MTSPAARDLPADSPAPSLEELSPGIWAYLQPDGSWFLNNMGFLVGSDAVVLVDTTSTEARTRALLAAIGSVTDLPVRTLVNTHSHGDHTHGNWLVPGATIVGHERCRTGIIEAGTSSTAMFPDHDWGELHPAPPTVTFERSLTVWVDDLEVQLRHLGPAHTDNDVVAWIPSRRLLLAGDLVFNGGCPFVMMGSVAGSLAAVTELRALDAELILPGHGRPCGPEVLDDVEAYLRFVAEVAAEGHAAGRTPLEAARHADLGRFASWGEVERLAPNLHRAYAELDGAAPGAALDLGPMLADMVAFNGGRMPHCLA